MKKQTVRNVLLAAITMSSLACFNAMASDDVTDPLLEMVLVKGAEIEGDFDYNSNIFREGTTVSVPSYFISKYEITQSLYSKAMLGSDLKLEVAPFKFKGSDLPAENVTWYDAVYFCNRLSEMSNLARAYDIKDVEVKNGHIVSAKVTLDEMKNGYRLPSELEWEYAARGGKKMSDDVYAGSDKCDEVAWTASNAVGKTHKVGTKEPNKLGIYDMSGNVWEYVYTPYSDIDGSNTPGFRIIKGGGWWNYVNYAAVSSNFIWVDNSGDGDLGIRVVRSFTEK